MGDTGSMMVGVMLSAAITTASGRVPQSDNLSAGNILALVSPVIVLVGIVFIPSLDLLMAVVRRTRAGTSPFSPDKMHLHHRLLQVGHSHRRAVLLVYLWVAVIAFGAVALALVPRTGLVLAATGIALAVAFVASAVPHRSRMRSASAAAAVAGETAIASTDDLPTPDVDDHRASGPAADGPRSGGSPAATGATGPRTGAGAATDGPADRRSAGGPAANGAGDRRPAGNPAANGAADRTGSRGRTTRPAPGRVVPGGNPAAGPEPWPRGVHRPAGARGAARGGPGTRAPASPVAPPPHAAGPPTPPRPVPVPVRPAMPRAPDGPPAPDPGAPGAAVPPPDGGRGPQHPRGDGNSDGRRARPAAVPGDQPTVPTPAHHPGHDGDA